MSMATLQKVLYFLLIILTILAICWFLRYFYLVIQN